MCRGNLSHTVTDHRVGDDTPRAPERSQGDLDRKKSRLDNIDCIKTNSGLVGSEFFQHRPTNTFGDCPVTGFQCLSESGLLGQQLLAHPNPLASLAREYEDKLFPAAWNLTSRSELIMRLIGLAPQKRIQLFNQSGLGVSD